MWRRLRWGVAYEQGQFPQHRWSQIKNNPISQVLALIFSSTDVIAYNYDLDEVK